ncbi:MAG TPA: N-acetyltransferase [Acidimicrobiales bacterium]|nr:N-acetyltransferase [Acidimicrobiales bacterium]
MTEPAAEGRAAWAVRSATAVDRDSILRLVEAAFTGPDHDAADEVAIVAETWSLGKAIEDLELVAEGNGSIVGHVLGARGDVGGDAVLAIAPLAVAPAHQHQGVGSALMTELLSRADRQGWPAAVLLGSPAYYRRFGFEPAGPLGLVYEPVGPDSPYFQVRRLSSFPHAPRGVVRYCWETAEG